MQTELSALNGILWVAAVAYALLAASYLLNHAVRYRALGAAAFVLAALAFAWAGGPYAPWGAVGAATLAVINLAQWAWLLRQRAHAKLSGEERALREWLFPSMGEMDFQRLLKVGRRAEIVAGSFLATQGQKLDQLHFITQGAAHVVANGMVVATLREGSLVGEVSFFRDDVATASVVAQGNLRVLSIGRAELRKLMRDHDDLQRALHESIGRDLGFKLTAFDQSHF